MNWIFYPRPGGAVGEWTCSSLENKATGKRTKKAFTSVNLFDVTDGLITRVRMLMDHTENTATFGDDLTVAETMIGVWGSGKLVEEKATFFPASFVLDGGNSKAPGFQQYDFDSLDRHLAEMDE